MVHEIKFRYDAQPVKNGEQFEMTFYKSDGEWELSNTNLDNYFVDAECLMKGVLDAMNTLEEVNKLERMED